MSTPVVTQRLKQGLPNQRQPFIDPKDGTLTWQGKKYLDAQNQAQQLIVPAMLANSHAARTNSSASGYAGGTLYYENDRRVFYILIAGVWYFASGVMQAQQDSLPTDLNNSGDVGFLCFVTDYAHLLRWNGSGWEWGPGESGSGYIVQFVQPEANSPLAVPQGLGWHACDGSIQVLTLCSDGTLQFTDVPNSANFYFRQ